MVRKLLDKLFSQKDLFWLDNILPEDSRRTKEDQLMALDFAALPTDVCVVVFLCCVVAVFCFFSLFIF